MTGRGLRNRASLASSSSRSERGKFRPSISIKRNDNNDQVFVNNDETSRRSKSKAARNSRSKSKSKRASLGQNEKLKLLQNGKIPKVKLNSVDISSLRPSTSSASNTSLDGLPNSLGKLPKISEALKKADISDLKILHRLCFDSDGKTEYLLKNLQSFIGYIQKPNIAEKTRFLMKIDQKQLNRIAKIIDIDSTKVSRNELICSILSFLRRPNQRQRPAQQHQHNAIDDADSDDNDSDVQEIEAEEDDDNDDDDDFIVDYDEVDDDESDISSNSNGSEDGYQSIREIVVNSILDTAYKYSLTKDQFKKAIESAYKKFEF